MMSNGVEELGAERFAKSQDDDRKFVRDAAKRWSAATGTRIDASDLLGLMTLCLSLAVQRGQMLSTQYASTIALLRELFVARLTGNTK